MTVMTLRPIRSSSDQVPVTRFLVVPPKFLKVPSKFRARFLSEFRLGGLSYKSPRELELGTGDPAADCPLGNT
jgi:hypothetical protein